MPFFRRHRKRRFHHAKCDSQEITYFRRQDMAVPENISTDGSGGLTASNLYVIPQIPNGTGMVGPVSAPNGVLYCGEQPLSNYIGQYNFDFSRWLYMTFGRPFDPQFALGGKLYQHSLVSYFRSLRFHTAKMTIERVDTGANTMMTLGTELSPTPTVSNSPVPSRVKLWWLRLGTHDPSFDPAVLTPSSLRGHPRARFAYLRVRHKISFRFHPVAFLPPKYTASLIRSQASTAGAVEGDMWQRYELPSRPVRLGFLPTSRVLSSWVNVRGATAAFSGVNLSMHRITSPTILFMFEEDMFGTSTVASGPGTGTQFIPISGCTIRRSESCAVTFRGLIPFQNAAYFADSNFHESGGIGAIEQTTLYSSPVPGQSVQRSTVETCDPPRATSITPSAGTDPLFRWGDVTTTFDYQIIPLDTTQGLAPYNASGTGTGYGPQQEPTIGTGVVP